MAQKIIAIAAIGKNRELGHQGNLLWHLPADWNRFKKATEGHPIIMGKKTFDSSIGKRPLPNRINIVVTRDTAWSAPGVVVAHSIERALDLARNVAKGGDIYVIGGGQIYTAALPVTTDLDLTLVDGTNPDADAFFPQFEDEFKETSRSPVQTENGVSYVFTTWSRR